MQKFGVAGIVAEYNPFHAGHRWMIQQLRDRGYHTIVCVMSGPFVQRAEPALLPTHVRVAAAVAGGADLVLRLPVPYAVASAEGFGAAGVGALAALGCVDALAFGAETADAKTLTDVATVLHSPEFGPLLRSQLATGVSFAAARSTAAEQLYPGAAEILRSPNNILGIEYIKALRHTLPPVLQKLADDKRQEGGEAPALRLPAPLPVARLGARHDGPPAEGMASASWLRAQVGQYGVPALFGWVPDACLPHYLRAEGEGLQIDKARWELAMLARLRGKTARDYDFAPGSGEGLGARLAAAGGQATSLEELYTMAKSKRFAHSRVRRAALAAALGLPRHLPVAPPFIQVLASNKTGRALLRTAKTTALLPHSTSLARLAKTGEAAAALVAAEAQAEDLYALCQTRPGPGGLAFTVPAHKV